MASAGAPGPRRLFVRNGGFLTERRVRRILSLDGWDICLGRPGPEDFVGVWGQSPTARRGEQLARQSGAPLVRVEDAFLRSLFPGRSGEPTLGLLIDRTGVHFDARAPSDLETLLASHPLAAPELLARAEALIASLARAHLSKFAATDPDLPVPDPGYVLVIDQTRGDASVNASIADGTTVAQMLDAARDEHPGQRIVIKAHPETRLGHRAGYLDAAAPGTEAVTEPVSPRRLLEGAEAVYTVSSGLGFEAILAGHRPVVFGTPFYAGWGLTDDRTTVARRERRLTRAQLVAAALILYPIWYDPYRDQLCEVEDVLRTLEVEARSWREDRHGWIAEGMSRWKRRHLTQFFGRHGRLSFSGEAGRRMVWANAAPRDSTHVRVEDGFLRSNGLGARLTPPLSLVLDDMGIYYDPTRPSRLEQLIAESPNLAPSEIEYSRRLIAQIRDHGITKYNIQGEVPDLPGSRPRILVVGQVEDDASVLLGAGDIATNAALLEAARRANPKATLIYKPHPDVEAGLRRGRLSPPDGVLVARDADPHTLLAHVDEVWTMTSLLGFEALLRGVAVTVTGVPFYAGWGHTRDLGNIPSRRNARPSLEALAHAVLVGYPRYFDPVTGRPCPADVAVDRLASGATPGPRGVLAALQALRGRGQRTRR